MSISSILILIVFSSGIRITNIHSGHCIAISKLLLDQCAFFLQFVDTLASRKQTGLFYAFFFYRIGSYFGISVFSKLFQKMCMFIALLLNFVVLGFSSQAEILFLFSC